MIRLIYARQGTREMLIIDGDDLGDTALDEAYRQRGPHAPAEPFEIIDSFRLDEATQYSRTLWPCDVAFVLEE